QARRHRQGRDRRSHRPRAQGAREADRLRGTNRGSPAVRPAGVRGRAGRRSMTEGDPAERFMRRALELAERGRGLTSPNPMVGAVVVTPAGEVVGEGFHARAGAPHAEVEALRAAGPRARGGTLYVTLEPCGHQGRTPPCVPTIAAAGVAS